MTLTPIWSYDKLHDSPLPLLQKQLAMWIKISTVHGPLNRVCSFALLLLHTFFLQTQGCMQGTPAWALIKSCIDHGGHREHVGGITQNVPPPPHLLFEENKNISILPSRAEEMGTYRDTLVKHFEGTGV